MSDNTKKKGLNISARCFITAIAVLLALMLATYILTFIIPAGEYGRVADADGNLRVDTESGFTYLEGGIPFYKWLLSPILVLGAEGNVTLIAVIAFLLIVGGIFNALEKGGLMRYMLGRIASKYIGVRYRLLALVVLFFMSMGAFVGSFEECVPLVPLAVALSVSLGWDALTGLYMSILATGCGFASGVCNPFTVGLAQEVAGLPMFSGILMRLAAFALIYLLLMLFIRHHTKKVERSVCVNEDIATEHDKKMNRGIIVFALILGLGILLVLCSVFIPALRDLTMIIVAVMFLTAGVAATTVSGMTVKVLLSHFVHGALSILPAVAMILMASSIKYTLVEAKVLDTLLHFAVDLAGSLPAWAVILFIYAIVLFMNFFISSGSAKVFLLMPLIVPLAEVFGISAQLCVLAFAFGDGFSNVFYPTNPVLLISLGVTDVSYGKCIKHTWSFQVINLLLTSLLLLLGLTLGY